MKMKNKKELGGSFYFFMFSAYYINKKQVFTFNTFV